MHASLIHSCTTCRGNKKHWLIFHPSPFSSKERTTMFLIDLPLEDKWEHPKFCGLEINVHKARKMGNVIKWIVCTVSELQKKKGYFPIPSSAGKLQHNQFQLFPNLSFKVFPFLPQHMEFLFALQWSQLCTDRSLVHFLAVIIFLKGWSAIMFFLCIWNGCPHLMYQVFIFIFFFFSKKLKLKFPHFITLKFHIGNCIKENTCS